MAEEQELNDDVIEEDIDLNTEQDDSVDTEEKTEEQEGDQSESDQEQNEEAEADDEIIDVIIEGEEPESNEEEKAPDWVRDLRKSHRETQKENKRLKAQLEEKAESKPKEIVLGEKPTLEGLDYDSEKYDSELAAWYERKREIEKQEEIAKAKQDKEKKAWDGKVANYNEKKTTLNVSDFDDAEENVKESLSVTQQGVILQGAENPALTVFALGKNPKKLKELSEIEDPIEFAFAVAKLETKMKTSRKKAPPPEKKVTGNKPMSGTVDSQLEKLREEAARTGDMSKVIAYKRANKK